MELIENKGKKAKESETLNFNIFNLIFFSFFFFFARIFHPFRIPLIQRVVEVQIMNNKVVTV